MFGINNIILDKGTIPYMMLQSVAAHIPDAVIISDDQFNIRFINARAASLLDIEGADQTRTFLSLLEDERCFVEEILPIARKQRQWQGDIITKGYNTLHVTLLQADVEDTASTWFIIAKDLRPTDETGVNTSTGDRRSENEIILSERKLRSVLNNSIGALFLLDTSLRILLANEKAIRLVRLASEEKELREGTSFIDILPAPRQEPVKAVLARVLAGEKIDYEIYYPQTGASGTWLRVIYTPVLNTDNSVNQICVSAYNITRQKENETALRQSEQRWKFAIEGVGDGVWEYNFQNKEIYYSLVYKTMLGYSEEEFPNEAFEWQSRVHPEDYYKIKDIDSLYTDGSIISHSVEYRLRNKSGEYVWVLDRGMLFERTPDGKPLKLIGTHTNITERKLAEQRLQQSEQRFASFMANTPTMTWIMDEYAVFRYMNAAYLKTFQLTKDAIGRSVYEFFPKAICDQFVENNWKVFTLGQPIEVMEEGVGPDGVKQLYQIFKFPLESENGIRMLGGVALDVTKRVELEQLLAEDEARKKQEIIQAIINAQEKERTELAYELHDNVNQILSSSKLMLEVAGERPELSNEFTQRGLAYLQEAIHEIRKISHNLTPTSLRDISLEVAVDDVVKSINMTGKLKVKYFKNILPGTTEMTPEKQLAILRIIQEQLNNILRHAHATTVFISLSITEFLLTLDIRDDGVGFDMKEIKKGVGLNNMFNRVEFYKGSIHFDTSPGHGCAVRIEIPLSANTG
jgi:PAS domain S-box-containing protein